MHRLDFPSLTDNSHPLRARIFSFFDAICYYREGIRHERSLIRKRYILIRVNDIRRHNS